MKGSKAPAYHALSFAFARSKIDKSSWKKIFSKEIEIFLKEIAIFSKEIEIFSIENLLERKFFSKENLLKINKRYLDAYVIVCLRHFSGKTCMRWFFW